MNHFCLGENVPKCNNEEGIGTCTQDFLDKIATFKKEKQAAQQRRKAVMEEENNNTKTKYIIGLFIIITPLIGMAVFLHWYKDYSNKKEDDLVIKHIDMINSKHSYISDIKDINSDSGSEAYMLVSKIPKHRKLNPYGGMQSPKSIFDDNDSDIMDEPLQSPEQNNMNHIIQDSYSRSPNYSGGLSDKYTSRYSGNQFSNSPGTHTPLNVSSPAINQTEPYKLSKQLPSQQQRTSSSSQHIQFKLDQQNNPYQIGFENYLSSVYN